MSTRGVARDFYRISGAYDATRDPIAPATLDRISASLRARGVHSILEVGVGTGRVGRPLLDRGFDLTGVDASPGMLAHAREKGLPRLVRGSGLRLPFAAGAFDGALFVHVLHLIDDPRTALAEAARVSRRGTFALVRPRSDPLGRSREAYRARQIVYRILTAQGYPVPSRVEGGPFGKERELLAAVPPDELVVVSDATVTEPLARSLDMLSARANRHTLDVPEEVVARAVAEARREVGDATFTFRRVEALASWRGAPAPA